VLVAEVLVAPAVEPDTLALPPAPAVVVLLPSPATVAVLEPSTAVAVLEPPTTVAVLEPPVVTPLVLAVAAVVPTPPTVLLPVLELPLPVLIVPASVPDALDIPPVGPVLPLLPGPVVATAVYPAPPEPVGSDPEPLLPHAQPSSAQPSVNRVIFGRLNVAFAAMACAILQSQDCFGPGLRE